MNYRRFSFLFLLIGTLTLHACSGDGENSLPEVTQLDVVPSGTVPYLLGPVSVTSQANAADNSEYDVTVSLDGDGPDGVLFVSVWIIEIGGGGDVRGLDLVNIGGNTWEVTTDPLQPLSPGNYFVDFVSLRDGDAFAEPAPAALKAISYFLRPISSSTEYYVNETIADWTVSPVKGLYIGVGLSDISIPYFTLP